MKDVCIIYALKNKINNKIYIGQTWLPLNIRWKAGYKGCNKIYNAINKYGKHNFYYESIIGCLNQIDADYLEFYFIEKYNSKIAGYNIKNGGSSGKLDIKTKKKISNSMKAHIRTEEHNKNISKSKMGINNPMFGKKHSKERIDEISKLHKNNTYCYKLTQDQANQIRKLSHLTRKELAKQFKVGLNTIHNILQNRTYKDDNYVISNKIEGKERAKLTTFQIEEIKELINNLSGKEIAEIYKVSESTISQIKNNKIWKDI